MPNTITVSPPTSAIMRDGVLSSMTSLTSAAGSSWDPKRLIAADHVPS